MCIVLYKKGMRNLSVYGDEVISEIMKWKEAGTEVHLHRNQYVLGREYT